MSPLTGLCLITAFYYKCVAPTALNGWREPPISVSASPARGGIFVGKPPKKNESPVRGDIFRHDFAKPEMRPYKGLACFRASGLRWFYKRSEADQTNRQGWSLSTIQRSLNNKLGGGRSVYEIENHKKRRTN
jgi:hypothetical protein